MEHGLVRDVGDVRDDRPLVELADDPLPLGREAPVGGGVGRGVAPLVGAVVGQGHVADPELDAGVQGAGEGQGAPVLQADQHAHDAAPGGPADVLGGGDDLHLPGERRQSALGRRMERQGVLPSPLGGERGRDVEREDDAVHSALPEARQVHMAVLLRHPQVGGGLPEAGGNVGVAVEDEAVVVEAHGERRIVQPRLLLISSRAALSRGRSSFRLPGSWSRFQTRSLMTGEHYEARNAP